MKSGSIKVKANQDEDEDWWQYFDDEAKGGRKKTRKKRGGKKEQKRPNGIKESESSQPQPQPQPPPPPQPNQRILQLLEDLARGHDILNHPNFNTLSEEEQTEFHELYDQNIEELIQEGVTQQQIAMFLQIYQHQQEELQQLATKIWSKKEDDVKIKLEKKKRPIKISSNFDGGNIIKKDQKKLMEFAFIHWKLKKIRILKQ